MSVAFVISAYKEPALLRRLVSRLDGRPCAVHIDAKVDLAPFAAALDGLGGVTMLPRHACHWGLFGHVAASLEGLRWFLRTGREHVMLLTGQCYPLRPLVEFEAWLHDLGPRSVISHDAFPHPRWMHGGADRIERTHIRLLGRTWHLRWPRRRLPRGLTAYGGSSYWCLARPAAAHVIAEIDAHPAIERFFRHVFIPDEILFQTLLASSHLRDTLIDDDVHYIEWLPHQPNPGVLTDAAAALRSGRFFARKFADAAVLDVIDAAIDRPRLRKAELFMNDNKEIGS